MEKLLDREEDELASGCPARKREQKSCTQVLGLFLMLLLEISFPFLHL
jgi:hypothetical protein